MGRNRLAATRESTSFLAGKFNRASVNRLAGNIALEQPIFRPNGPPVTAQRLQQLGRQHHVAILLTLALIDTDDHTLTIDISSLQMDAFGDAKAGRIARCENRSMLWTAHTTEKVEHLLWAQDHRQSLGFLWRGDDVLKSPVLLEGDLIEKPQGGDGDQDRASSELPFLGQINLIRSDVLRPQLFWCQNDVRTGTLVARKTSGCSVRDSAPACLRSCVVEGMSWKAP